MKTATLLTIAVIAAGVASVPVRAGPSLSPFHVGTERTDMKRKLHRREDLHQDDDRARRHFKRLQKEQYRLLNAGRKGQRTVRSIAPTSRSY